MEEKINNQSLERSLFYVFISAAIHVLIFVSMLYMPKEDVSEPDTPLEVYLQETKQENLFVNAPPVKEEIKKPKDEVKFKSHQTQRTSLETWKALPQSQMSSAGFSQQGQNQKKMITQKNKGGGPQKEKTKDQKKYPVAKDGDFTVAEKSGDNRKPLLLPGFGSTSSPPQIPTYIQEKMPDGIELGNITALNTDQHRYYSFNQRLLSSFIPRWGNMVSKALYQWLQENNFPPVSKSWVTQVEVIMNDKGEIIDVQPFRLSGLWAIDQSAIKAFKYVNNVPNPPQEMIDENGYIHLQFQTEVLWVPQPKRLYHSETPRNDPWSRRRR